MSKGDCSDCSENYTETCYYSQKLHDWLRHKPFTRWYVDVLLDEIERLQARIAELEEQLQDCRWIRAQEEE
jgi:hypothetical protein